jgi:hypothetical protein
VRRTLLLLASVAIVGSAGCRHRCNRLCDRDDRRALAPVPPPPPSRGLLLPPTTLPTTPAPSVQPGPSGFAPPPPPASLAPKPGGPEVLFPDPIPSSAAKPTTSGLLGAPTKPQTAEPPKVAASLPGYAKVKEGLFAGGKPALDGFEALKANGFRTVVFLHGHGADAAAVRDAASTRGLNCVAIETTPEALADAAKEFDRVANDRNSRPAYVFADAPERAGAVWYLHFRTTDAVGDDVARLRAKPLGYGGTGDDAKAFALAVQRALESR